MTEREFDVLNYINIHEMAKTEKISADLKISESTVRRILDRLEQKKLVVRFHGGASKKNDTAKSEVNSRFDINAEIKNSIAGVASDMIKDGSVIIMLGGTTVANMCKFLQNKRLTVITNSLLVFNMLKNNLLIKMILLGGEYSKEEDELKGSLTNSMMLRLGADYLFTSCSAFNERRGFLTNHIDSIELYNSCYEATKNVVMLSDSSKYMKNAIAVIAECSRVNCLISDKRLPQEAVMKFQEQSIRVITV